jgi:hypothetical protein
MSQTQEPLYSRNVRIALFDPRRPSLGNMVQARIKIRLELLDAPLRAPRSGKSFNESSTELDV